MTVLGIETSCDETAAAIVHGRPPGPATILANIVASQIPDHAPFGGVVPEIAARRHLDLVEGVVARALSDAQTPIANIAAIAVTAGPGLIAGVTVGLLFAKGLAQATGKPLIALNHLEAHALTVRLTHAVPYPFLLLLVSGGHCQIVRVDGLGVYTRLGTTLDDAAGEAFDKTAKLLGLGFPGGPAIERAAQTGDPSRFVFPRPLADSHSLDFSFSGLKTNIRRLIESLPSFDEQTRRDIAAGAQAAIRDVLVRQTSRAMGQERERLGPKPHLVVAGGVAANAPIRDGLTRAAVSRGYECVIPPARLCTDNAAMVAWAGLERLRDGQISGLDVSPRARWPLDARYAHLKAAKS